MSDKVLRLIPSSTDSPDFDLVKHQVRYYHEDEDALKKQGDVIRTNMEVLCATFIREHGLRPGTQAIILLRGVETVVAVSSVSIPLMNIPWQRRDLAFSDFSPMYCGHVLRKGKPLRNAICFRHHDIITPFKEPTSTVDTQENPPQ